MIPIKADLNTWPRRKNGEPIFRTTNDAIFYAQLASKEFNVVQSMRSYRNQAHELLMNARNHPDPNLDLLMECAMRAQLFRECWEEIERINEEGKE